MKQGIKTQELKVNHFLRYTYLNLKKSFISVKIDFTELINLLNLTVVT